MKKLSRLSSHWDRLNGDELRSLQLEKLNRYLNQHVMPFSAYYRELFANSGINEARFRSFDDLAELPFSSKRSLVDEDGTPKTRDFVLVPDEDVLRRRPGTLWHALRHGPKSAKVKLAHEYRPVLMTSTTGRSAEPVPFLYSQHDLDVLAVTGHRMMRICDSKKEFRHLNLFPFAPHLAFWQAHYAGLGYNTFSLSTGGGKVMGTEGNVRLIDKIQPDALIGMPTFIYHVLQVAAESGVTSPNIKRIVLGGEKVPNGLRRKLRALCAELGSGRVEVMATYGFTEAKMAWPECPVGNSSEPSGYHLYPDLGIIEVVDPDSGKPVGEGEPGEIVFTPLDSRGSVVLRYRTGDLISGGLTHEPCPSCGRSMPRLLGRISRVSDVRRLNIDKVKGTLVNFNELENVLDDLDEVGSWQIELRKRNNDPLECDEILVHVAASRGEAGDSTARERLTRKIEARLSAAAELRPNRVEFHEAEVLREKQGVGRNLKEAKVVDHREEAASPPLIEPRKETHHEIH
ncbi:MAG: AMP-binding protein [Verrucomicrobiota bacterium]